MKWKFIPGVTLILLSVPLLLNANMIRLSPEEQAWIQQHDTIVISGPKAFPPFQYIDDDGAFKGMASDYVLTISKMAGLKIKVVSDLPWAEVLEKIRRKEIDVLTCAAKTPGREEYLIYTKPHLSFPLIIVSRKDAPFISGFQDLHRKRIALTRKVSTYEWLQQEKTDFTPIFVQSPLEALEKVSLGHADATIQNLAAATWLIEKNGIANLKIAAPTSYGDYDLSIAVRRDWPELSGIFEKGLSALSPEQHNEIRQKWIAVRYEHGIHPKDIVKWVLLTCAVAAIVLSVFFLWNRRLAREIRERKKAESERERLITKLQSAIDEIKTLRGILPICSECKKIRDDKGYWTQIESYIMKHSEADFSHSICPGCAEKLYGHEEWYQKKGVDQIR
ncbi:hypothetical protein DENIS_1239 [Desulfonema ishimotonii]|uniref:Solute-binding protein family 3/N-terminal domain-containing protein n=1 Tax=Desulfonema ishimotonii TaxID=45657 RepID=A0A401FTK5_9BACT|nr:transporter substrate-binding domain-containing protein [Desulfonema ishimotonii]GBC60288.1 hypothetical protein DENIS_1239 [Desulfonema ishimotonii]